NWLEKTDQIGADVDDGTRNDDEKNDKQGGEGSPHRSFLPRSWICAHADSNLIRAVARRREAFNERNFNESSLHSGAHPCSFWFSHCRSYRRVFYFSGRG